MGIIISYLNMHVHINVINISVHWEPNLLKTHLKVWCFEIHHRILSQYIQMPDFYSFNFYIHKYVCVLEMRRKFQNTKVHIF